MCPILKTDLPPNNSEDVKPKPIPKSTPPCSEIHSLVLVLNDTEMSSHLWHLSAHFNGNSGSLGYCPSLSYKPGIPRCPPSRTHMLRMVFLATTKSHISGFVGQRGIRVLSVALYTTEKSSDHKVYTRTR